MSKDQGNKPTKPTTTRDHHGTRIPSQGPGRALDDVYNGPGRQKDNIVSNTVAPPIKPPRK